MSRFSTGRFFRAIRFAAAGSRPQVLSELGIDPPDYGRGRAVAADHRISHRVDRRTGDRYRIQRDGELRDSPARVRRISVATLGRAPDRRRTHSTSLQRDNDGWIVNGNIRARLVVGAGGHFCPVAKLTGAKPPRENAVVAQEAEFEMDERQQAGCRVRAEIPELYFCADIKGYGWCFRKQNFLNIGLGRMDQHRLLGTRGGVRSVFASGGADHVRSSRGSAGPRLSSVRRVGTQASG